jgi:hypothetical protein
VAFVAQFGVDALRQAVERAGKQQNPHLGPFDRFTQIIGSRPNHIRGRKHSRDPASLDPALDSGHQRRTGGPLRLATQACALELAETAEVLT